MTSISTRVDWDESASAPQPPHKQDKDVFDSFFERSFDAVWLFDPQVGAFVDCNQAAVELIGARSKAELLPARPEDLSPAMQPGGLSSIEKTAQILDQVEKYKCHRFEWVVRHMDGHEIPLEVSATQVHMSGRKIHVSIARDISQRRKAEQESRELNHSLERRVAERTAELSTSEAKFRALFEGASQGVVLHDEKQIIEVNPAAVRILGRRFAHEMIGKHPGEFSPPFQPNGRSSAAMAGQYIDQCMTWGSARFDWLACDPNGKEISLEVNLTRIQWSNRQVIQAFITDITERKRSEAALAESEARFSAAFSATPVCMTIGRLEDGRYVLANEAFLEWTGYRLEEVLGRTSQNLNLWADPEQREPFWKELRRAGFVHQREVRVRNRKGEIFTMLLSADVIEINRVPHLLTVGLDITQRKQAEAELRGSEARLRESEARFSAAFQASPALIGILRIEDGKYVLANDAHLNWMGYSREQVLGRTCLELNIWENPAERDLVLGDMARSGSIRQRECRWLNRRGERFTILLSAETIQLNNVPHMLVMGLDITQRKRAEEELRKTLEREKELSQLKSNFVSMVSHEFRTPLGIIQSSAELLNDFHERMQLGERQEQLDSISRNTRRMAAMMEEVLVLSRLDAGKLEFRPNAIDLNLFCRRIVDEVLSATNRRCPIELSLNSIPCEGAADDRLLGHIFTNLLSNAVKYSEPGTTVHFTLERAGRDVVCLIRDQGIGISEEDQRQLFNAFHRGANVGTRPGTGLGLLLVKRCADLHGGKVRIESKIARGTTVTVTLPVFERNHEKNSSDRG